MIGLVLLLIWITCWVFGVWAIFDIGMTPREYLDNYSPISKGAWIALLAVGLLLIPVAACIGALVWSTSDPRQRYQRDRL